VLVVVVDSEERILLLGHPERGGGWEIVNGMLEAGETVLAGALRETREEAGASLQVEPLGTVHARTFRYDDAVGEIVSICYVMAHRGGTVTPGDDMAGSAVRWTRLDELDELSIAVPSEQWMLERAVELYRLWNGRPAVALEAPAPSYQ